MYSKCPSLTRINILYSRVPPTLVSVSSLILRELKMGLKKGLSVDARTEDIKYRVGRDKEIESSYKLDLINLSDDFIVILWKDLIIFFDFFPYNFTIDTGNCLEEETEIPTFSV